VVQDEGQAEVVAGADLREVAEYWFGQAKIEVHDDQVVVGHRLGGGGQFLESHVPKQLGDVELVFHGLGCGGGGGSEHIDDRKQPQDAQGHEGDGQEHHHELAADGKTAERQVEGSRQPFQH
jgi:hypothetical protein